MTVLCFSIINVLCGARAEASFVSQANLVFFRRLVQRWAIYNIICWEDIGQAIVRARCCVFQAAVDCTSDGKESGGDTEDTCRKRGK